MLSPWSIAAGHNFPSVLLVLGQTAHRQFHEVCTCQSRLSDADNIGAICELRGRLVNQS
jgi:hypothetical protein